MFTLNCNGNLLVAEQPLVMGIINVTTDSFYASSRLQNITAIVDQVTHMIDAGVAIIDIGAQSTRPGSTVIDAKKEIEISKPVIEAIRSQFGEIPISIDTYYPEVADAAIQAGANMINDISGGRFFPEILAVAASQKVPYICMHSHGTRNTMHEKLSVDNIIDTVIEYFAERIEVANAAGIIDFIIDPGFGFGKTKDDNFTLIKELSQLQILQKPILVGVSRKSSIYQTLNTTAENALNGTTVVNTAALLNGANILRVHDVKEAVEAITLTQILK